MLNELVVGNHGLVEQLLWPRGVGGKRLQTSEVRESLIHAPSGADGHCSAGRRKIDTADWRGTRDDVSGARTFTHVFGKTSVS